MRPIPAVALIPLALLIYGFGVRMEVLVVTYATVWPVLIVTIRPCAVSSAASRSRPDLGDATLQPHAAYCIAGGDGTIAVGIRVSAGVALVVAVTVEIGSTRRASATA